MFLQCDQCGNLFYVIKDSKMPATCCNSIMKEIKVNETEEGLTEKHKPVYELCDRKLNVKVGSILHPSLEEHRIEWIALLTDKGIQIRYISSGDEPITCFKLCRREKILSIYAYCNIHGLWKEDFTYEQPSD